MTNPSQSYGPTGGEPGSEAGQPTKLKEQPLTWILLASKFGVSVQTMKVWRVKEGAPVTTDLGEWEAFVKKEGLGTTLRGFTGGALKDEKTKHEIEILKARLAREKRLVIPADEVNTLLLYIATQSRTELYQFMETEAPPKLDGMSAAQMRPILREMADTICGKMEDMIKDFEER